MALSREQIIRHLGDLDDLTVSRIVDTGASEKDLEEAIGETVRREELGEPTPPSTRPEVIRLRVILEELAEESRWLAETDYD